MVGRCAHAGTDVVAFGGVNAAFVENLVADCIGVAGPPQGQAGVFAVHGQAHRGGHPPVPAAVGGDSEQLMLSRWQVEPGPAPRAAVVKAQRVHSAGGKFHLHRAIVRGRVDDLVEAFQRNGAIGWLGDRNREPGF